MTTIAIDFGTSNTVVSILETDTQLPKTLRFSNISRSSIQKDRNKNTYKIFAVPTLVFIREENELILGEQVRSQRLGSSQPNRLFQGFKRDLAADYQPPARFLDNQTYTPELVAELFIKEIWQQVKHLQIEPTQVIFTVPVGAFERYLDWFREIGNSLGVDRVQLVDESTAAALGYAVKTPDSLVLVVDFGGGTLDLSLVRTNFDKQETTFKAEVIAKSDAYVGGEDIDIWIVDDYLRSLNSSREAVGEVGWQNLLEIAEKLKISLSVEEVAKESWFDDENFMSHELQLDREKLAEILEQQQLLEQLRNSLDEVLAIALSKGISKSDIEQVLLVGGSCLIPAVQNLITSYFGKKKVKLDKPFEAVCHGALALSQITEIEDYLRHSYAIRLWQPQLKSYSYFTIFDRGLQYPCQTDKPLTLQVATEGQTEIRLDIGEVAEVSQAEVSYDEFGRMTSGELQQQQQYSSLKSHHGKVCLAHLDPPGEAGVDRITVDFAVNEKRVLLATVKDLLTGEVLVDEGAIANTTQMPNKPDISNRVIIECDGCKAKLRVPTGKIGIIECPHCQSEFNADTRDRNDPINGLSP